MSANYWRNRWINALVHNGIDRKVAADAFTEIYRHQSADQSKSPETQALMAFGLAGTKQGGHHNASASQSSI